jgi:hypothetical protein
VHTPSPSVHPTRILVYQPSTTKCQLRSRVVQTVVHSIVIIIHSSANYNISQIKATDLQAQLNAGLPIITRPGDLIELGLNKEHRILCGDVTKPTDAVSGGFIAGEVFEPYQMSDFVHGFTWEIRAQITVLPESSRLIIIKAFAGQEVLIRFLGSLDMRCLIAPTKNPMCYSPGPAEPPTPRSHVPAILGG